MKKFLLVLFVLFYVNAFSQINVKPDSFRKIEGYLMFDQDSHKDDNWKPMALIKVSTENMAAEQRARLQFHGNMGTFFDVHQMECETWVYLTAQAATFLEIMHPDYGKTEFWLPEDLCDFCGYEMVVQYQPLAPQVGQEKSKINYLLITADRPDASIYINGNLEGEKEVSLPLSIGVKYEWKVECKYYHTESGSIVIKDGAVNEINVVMRPAYGFMKVGTSPEAGATVYIDGEKVGKTPYESGKLSSGDHKVRVVKEMYKTVEETVTVTDGNTTTALINMPANYVVVTVKTDSDSDIYLDNVYKGKGTWKGRLSEGTHYFEARKASHESSGKNVVLKLGSEQTIEIDAPKPIYGFLSINSDPMRADIYIDGVHYGQTPKVINELLVGTHELVLKKDGCTDIRRSISIEKDQTLNIKEILSSGKVVSIITGSTGDQVYIDGNYEGLTPLTINLSYGSHDVTLKRGSQNVSKKIDVSAASSQKEFYFTFGKLISIISSRTGDEIYVDGVYKGKTPASLDFTLGKHEIVVKRGKMQDKITIDVTKDSKTDKYYLYPKQETLYEYLKYGVNFVTVNAAYSVAPQTSFGITFGSVDEFGWYVSLMSNFNFAGANKSTQTGTVMLTGESCASRISATAGVVMLVSEPLYIRAGLGYGMRVKYWKTSKDNWVEYPGDSYRGLDMTAGVLLNTKKVSYSLDVVTTNFETMEFKLGIGLNWKK